MHEFVFFYPKGHEAHFEQGHPERPERIEAMCQALEGAGWWNAYPHLEAKELSLDFLAQVHSRNYLDFLQTACQRGAHLDMDTYTTRASWNLALKAAGGAVSVAEAVWEGKARRGFALTRPPGHHATRGRGMGFCLLNNIAITAEYLLSQPMENGQNPDRLAIVDLDLHHGNGTQDIFWDRSDVFYISTHQSPHYPGSGALEERGAGDGLGYTANFPMPPFTGDRGFSATMDELILPLLERYDPQMVLVSYGFDPHWRDPLGHLMLSAAAYGDLIRRLVRLVDDRCQGRIVIFLEGGYDLQAAQACAQAVTAALLGADWQDPLGPSPQPEGTNWQGMLLKAHQIWEV
jgi:acetoin utilization deacetylase AcuC-like enzyme